jgi:hypothetical protein
MLPREQLAPHVPAYHRLRDEWQQDDPIINRSARSVEGEPSAKRPRIAELVISPRTR